MHVVVLLIMFYQLFHSNAASPMRWGLWHTQCGLILCTISLLHIYPRQLTSVIKCQLFYRRQYHGLNITLQLMNTSYPVAFHPTDSLFFIVIRPLRGLILYYPDTINIKVNLQNPLTYILLQVTNPQKQLTNNYCMWKNSLKSGDHLKTFNCFIFSKKTLNFVNCCSLKADYFGLQTKSLLLLVELWLQRELCTWPGEILFKKT